MKKIVYFFCCVLFLFVDFYFGVVFGLKIYPEINSPSEIRFLSKILGNLGGDKTSETKAIVEGMYLAEIHNYGKYLDNRYFLTFVENGQNNDQCFLESYLIYFDKNIRNSNFIGIKEFTDTEKYPYLRLVYDKIDACEPVN